MTIYYRDKDGKYVGGFDGVLPPIGSMIVPFAPGDARMLWDGDKWIEDPALEDEIIKDKIDDAAQKESVTMKEMVDALWERVVKGNASATDEIEAILDRIALDFPKK